MPYKRRRFKKRVLKKDLQKPTKRQVKSMISRSISTLVEEKFHNEFTDDPNVFQVSTTQTFDVSDLVIGDNDTSRIGDEVRIVSIDFMYNILRNPDATADTWLRVILYQYKLDTTNLTSTTPPVAQILQDPTVGRQSISSHYNHDFEKYVHIIYDRVHNVPFSVTDSNHMFTLRKPIKFYKGFNKKLKFIGQDTPGNNGINKIFLLVFSTQSVSGEAPTFQAHTRINYRDA